MMYVMITCGFWHFLDMTNLRDSQTCSEMTRQEHERLGTLNGVKKKTWEDQVKHKGEESSDRVCELVILQVKQ